MLKTGTMGFLGLGLGGGIGVGISGCGSAGGPRIASVGPPDHVPPVEAFFGLNS